MQTSAEPIDDVQPRDRCYGCFRPRRDCFCHTIPKIDNRTEVLIVQHVRERFHPFNTARIVNKALDNSRLIVDHTGRLADQLALRPGAALLYPGPSAKLLSDVSASELPSQLVVLDGTWHHAKTLLREMPTLRSLPRYRLAPEQPGQYRIRREPTAIALSTVEAIVAALAVIEPETPGFEQLIASFNAMVERQLAHPKAQYGWRRNERRGRTVRNIPIDVVENLQNVVVVYGEMAPGIRGQKRTSHMPVYWVAERLATGERFESAIQPSEPLPESFLAHCELSPSDFAGALPLKDARAAWAAFARPSDIFAAYYHGTARQLTHLHDRATTCLVLQAVDMGSERYQTLEELAKHAGLKHLAARHRGRAGKRLALTATLARHLNEKALIELQPQAAQVAS